MRKMGTILEAFAENELCMEEESERRSPEHQRLCEEAGRLQCKLEEKLDEEERQLLDSLTDVLSEEYNCYAKSRFVRGYRLGVLMTMEVFADQDTFVPHPPA